MRKLFSFILISLLVLASTTPVFANNISITTNHAIPIQVNNGGVWVNSGSYVNIHNNLSSSINVLIPSIQVQAFPYKWEFEIDVPNQNLNFVVNSPNVFVNNVSSSEFYILIPSPSDITILIEPAMGFQGFSNFVTVTTQSTPANGGTVLPATGSHLEGSTINLSAVAAGNWHFHRWHTADLTLIADINDPNTTMTVPANDVTVNAVFGQQPPNGGGPGRNYTLTLSTRGNGTVQGAGSYRAGEVVNILAVPATGYQFVRWDLVGVGNVDPATSASARVTMSTNISLTAVFEPAQPERFSVSFHASQGFTFSGAGLYQVGATVTIQAHNTSPAVEFVRWNLDAAIQVANPYNMLTTFIMPASNVSISMISRPVLPTHPLTVQAERGGWIQSDESLTVSHNTIVELRAQASRGYRFDRWITSGGGSFGAATNRITTFTMPNNPVTVTATFVRDDEAGGPGGPNDAQDNRDQARRITLVADPQEGGDPILVNTAPARYRETRQIQARPVTGWTFDRWEITAGRGTINNINSPVATFTMGATGGDVTIVAHYTSGGFDVINNQTNVTVDRTNPVPVGTVVTLTVQDSRNVVNIPLTAAGAVANPTATRTQGNTFTFTMPNANVTVGAPQFEAGAPQIPPVPPGNQQPPPQIDPPSLPNVPNVPNPPGAAGGNTPAQTASEPTGVLDIGTGYLEFTPHAEEDLELPKTNDLVSMLGVSLLVFFVLIVSIFTLKRRRI